MEEVLKKISIKAEDLLEIVHLKSIVEETFMLVNNLIYSLGNLFELYTFNIRFLIYCF